MNLPAFICGFIVVEEGFVCVLMLSWEYPPTIEGGIARYVEEIAS